MKHDNYAGAGSVVFPKFRPARFLRSVTLRDGADVSELVISIRTLPAKRDCTSAQKADVPSLFSILHPSGWRFESNT